MRTIIYAYSLLGFIGLTQAIKAGFNIVLVFTHTNNPNENIWFPSVAKLAKENGIKVIETDEFTKKLWYETIKEVSPDYMLSFNFRKMIHSDILALSKKGNYNMHPSLLPAYRGKAPINWAVINGETKSGLTIHEMVKGADTGKIINQTAVDIGPDETAKDIFAKIETLAPSFIYDTLLQIKNNTFKAAEQDISKATLFPTRTPEDGLFSFGWPAQKIHNLVRGVTHPFPGAFIETAKGRLYFWSSKVNETASEGKPGVILSADPLIIQCGIGSLKAESLGFENKELSAGKFVKEYGLKPGGFIAD